MQSEAGPSTVTITEKRGLKACSACRIAKVRCHSIPDSGICVRCQSAAIPCHFTTTRRGRVKGSKNRKTLEKLANGLRDATKNRSPTSGTQCEAWAAEDMGLDPPSIDPRLADTVDHAMARAQSPLDPFVSTVPSPSPAPQRNLEAAARPPRHSMTRSSVQTMAGSFPTGSERTIADPMPQADFSTGRNVHNPLLFLAECARRGWDSADGAETRTASTTAPAPSTTLPLEDAIRLGRWSPEKLSQIIADQRKYFQHGLHGIKRDVSIALDPVYQNVVKEDQVVTLFDNYFRHVHCQWAILDRDVHTPTYVRSRSAFLFTVVLALGATSIATLSASTIHDSTLAIKLWGHLEKLQLVVCATAAKSIEIVQGMLLAQMWALRTPRLVDDQRATRLGITVRMANQIGLQLSKSRGTCPGDQRNMNDFKARLSLVLVESRWESIADRQDISCPGFDLTEVEAEELDRTGPFDDNAILAADYALYRFEAESKERISRVPPNARMATAMDSERVWIQTYLSSWDRKWVDPQPDPLRRWWFRYLSIRSRLVGILRVAKARTQAGPWTDHMRADLLLVSTELLEGCLSHERAMHMLRPTSPIVFAAAILLQLTKKDAPERDLILRVALRLAGEPKQGDIMTYAVHNGYQILNMLCLSKEVARTAGGSMAGNPNYTQASVPPLVQHEEHVQQQQHQQQPQQRQQQDHIPAANQRADPPSITTYQLYEDIDQLLGLEPGFTGTGIAQLGQWQGGVAHSEHSTNTMWSDFLSTEPMSAEGSGIETQSVKEIPGSGYSAWPVNVVEDPLNLVVGDGQMTDNDISDFYFHLASALGG